MFAEKFWIMEILFLFVPFLLLMCCLDVTNVEMTNVGLIRDYLLGGINGPRWKSYRDLTIEMLNTVMVAVLLAWLSYNFHEEWYHFGFAVIVDNNNKFDTKMNCSIISISSNVKTGSCYLGSNKYLGQQIFASTIWLWILLGLSLVNLVQKMLLFCKWMKVLTLKSVVPLLHQKRAADLATYLSYGDMIAIVDSARCIGAEDFTKICFDMQKTVNPKYRDSIV